MAKKTESRPGAGRLPKQDDGKQQAKKPATKPDKQPAKKQSPEKAAKAPRAEYNVTPEQFITVWQTSHTVQEVSDELGMPKPIVLARASSYRSMGILLKPMKRDHKRALNIDALNIIIGKLRAGRSPEDVRVDAEAEAEPDDEEISLPRMNEDVRHEVEKLVKEEVRRLLKEKDGK